MEYRALYRKLRPKVFEDVIGQEHIITTLKNQIKTKSIAHAYLFSGTRGTGKTSTAKIFARAINCLKQSNANPCNECEVCRGILNENIMDVMEIDAASNNGVDNIREIRENVKYPPSRGIYKVYIIDEVHMLSTGAFNALLKTLEEPPTHVIFILATTEIHKLPSTILSRCQKFDFKPVKIKDITERLKTACQSLGIESEDEALRLIATHAEGALRDALSLLEQCMSFNLEKIKYDDVLETLGAVNHDVLIDLSSNLINKITGEVLYSIDRMVMEGKDIHQLAKDLIQHFRSLLLARLEVNLAEMLPLSQEAIILIKEQSKKAESNWLVAGIQMLSEIESRMKFASNPRILFEVGLVSLCNSQFGDSHEGLLERVKYLESEISEGAYSKRNYKDQEKNITELNYGVKKQKEELKNAPQEDPIALEKNQVFNDPELQKQIESKWNQIIDEIRKEKKASSLALLKEGTLAVLSQNKLEISFGEEMELFKQKLDRDKVKQYISSVIEKHIGQKLEVVFSIQGENIEQLLNNEEQVIKKIRSIVPESIFEIIDE